LPVFDISNKPTDCQQAEFINFYKTVFSLIEKPEKMPYNEPMLLIEVYFAQTA